MKKTHRGGNYYKAIKKTPTTPTTTIHYVPNYIFI